MTAGTDNLGYALTNGRSSVTFSADFVDFARELLAAAAANACLFPCPASTEPLVV